MRGSDRGTCPAPATSSLAVSLTTAHGESHYHPGEKERAEHRSWSELSAFVVRDLQATSPKEHAADCHPAASSSEISLAGPPGNNLGNALLAVAPGVQQLIRVECNHTWDSTSLQTWPSCGASVVSHSPHWAISK